MANKILDWALFGSYGTSVNTGTNVDTGGVKVTVGFNAQDHGASATTETTGQYVATGETFDSNSGLALYGLGGEGGIDNTSTTTLNFSSTNAIYQDEVTNVSFRINDVDKGNWGDPHQDIVTIRAYDADGNLIPVSLTNGSGVSLSGSTATGTAEDSGTINPMTASASVLVHIDGPVSRIEIDYDNGDCTDQKIWVTDVHFDTISADLRDGYVEGTNSDDMIDHDYVGDPDGDKIDNNDAILPGEAADDDIVLAGDGNDTVLAGAGNDEVYAGGGDDSVDGGTGNDVIYGDSDLGGTPTGGETVRESFEWNLAPDPNSSGAIDNGDPLSGGFTQNTGNVDVTFSIGSTNFTPTTTFDNNQQKVHSITDDGQPVDAFSSMGSLLDQNGECAVYNLDFSNEVGGVSFRINDIDNASEVTIKAFDADGNQVAVNVSTGSGIHSYDLDGVGGREYLESNGNDGADTDPSYSALVNIAGPVARLEITHNMDSSLSYGNNAGINITDVYFDATVAPELGGGNEGDDTLDGGLGDDLIFGEGGNDDISGGAGHDTVFGGAGADSIDGDAGNDVLYGGGLEGSGPNLITNGSFENTSGMTATGYGYVGNGAIPGWTDATGKQIDVHNDDRGGVQPTDGNNWLDLEASPGNNLVGQNVAGVVDGQPYVLSFDAGDIALADDGLPGDNLVQVFWGGQLVGTINPTDGDMSHYEFTVIGGSGNGSDRLEFGGLGTQDNLGASIDNVSLVAGVMGGIDAGDTINGGDGDDVAYGQGGDDALTGGEGADTLSGGADQDTFIGGTAGDVVDGGTDGVDNDTLDLSDLGPLRIVGQTLDADGDSTSGTVEFLDGAGNVTGTMTFTEIENLILPENMGPTANDDAASTDEDTPVTINVLGNDTDPELDPLTISGTPMAEHGTVVVNPDGTITYTPDENFNGTDTITYTVDDGMGGTDTATVTVNVGAVNDDPVANDDDATTDEDTPVTIDVLGNDTDSDGDPLSIVGTPTADNGTVVVNPDGTITYTPDENFNGTDTITYTVDDGMGGTDTATVTVTVAPVNDDPVAEDDTASTPFNTAVTIPVLLNDTDVDGDTLSVLGTPTSADGTVVVNPDGTITFTPTPGFEGVATIEYTVTDGNGGTDTATVSVTVDEQPLDGIVEGTSGNDVIDVTFTGDPEGDMVDNNDALLPGEVGEDDIIEAYEGDDYVDAGLGNDEVDAGSGNDTVYGREGDDIIDGGEGNDSVRGNEGDDTLIGGAGMDTLRGGEDNDTVDGGADDDLLYGGEGDDSVMGGLGNDELNGNEGKDTLEGGEGNDVINAGSSSEANDYVTFLGVPVDANPDDDRDFVDGGAGDDTITTGDDADTVIGGTGNDVIDSGIDADSVIAGEGNDYVDAGLGSDFVDGGEGDDTIIAGIEAFSDYTGDDPTLPYPGLFNPDGTVAVTDPNREDGKDTVLGGAGNDYIVTGDDADSIEGGADNDTILAGIDDDYVDGGTGDDSIIGGHGSDSILGGEGNDWINAGDSALLWGQATDDVDLVPENGRDFVDGGAGNDTIFGEDDKDTLLGGTGDDVIDGGIDDDSIDGGEGNDSLLGDEGKDTILGGAGNDTIDGGRNADNLEGGDGDDVVTGGNGEDTLLGGAGNDYLDGGTGGDLMDGGEGDDTIVGSSGRDSIDGGDGNDVIDSGLGEDVVNGGAGDDSITAGPEDDTINGDAGDDTITGGNGADVLTGGDDRDTFLGATDGDVIDGNEGGDDYDTLDLRGAAPLGGSISILYDANPENGTVEYRDAAGAVIGTMTFQNIENVIPCFTPGTTIATPKGERLVEELQVGDRVITRDNGLQEIRWIGAKPVTGVELQRNPHLKPVLIKRGALGNGLPERDMLVSPNHRVLVNNEKTALYFEEREVLAAAKHLIGADGIHEVNVMGTTYIHFMFDHHEVVLSNGAWTESFQPGDYSLEGIGNSQRNEIFELFPELKTKEGIEDYQSARRSLKKHEAKLLIK